MERDTSNKVNNEPESSILFCKTQYAGIEVHKRLILLLKYISEKYFHNMEASDEGEYWETGNDDLLKQNFQKYSNIISYVTARLELEIKLPGEDEDLEEYFRKLLKDYREKK